MVNSTFNMINSTFYMVNVLFFISVSQEDCRFQTADRGLSADRG